MHTSLSPFRPIFLGQTTFINKNKNAGCGRGVFKLHRNSLFLYDVGKTPSHTVSFKLFWSFFFFFFMVPYIFFPRPPRKLIIGRLPSRLSGKKKSLWQTRNLQWWIFLNSETFCGRAVIGCSLKNSQHLTFWSCVRLIWWTTFFRILLLVFFKSQNGCLCNVSLSCLKCLEF